MACITKNVSLNGSAISKRAPARASVRTLAIRKDASAPASSAAAAVAAATLVAGSLLGTPAFASTPAPVYEVAGLKDIFKEDNPEGKTLQERSDETFKDIVTSPAKTGNEADAIRPDLQKSTIVDKASNTAATVADSVNAAPKKLEQGVEKVTSEDGPGLNLGKAIQSQAAKADALGKSAAENTRKTLDRIPLTNDVSTP